MVLSFRPFEETEFGKEFWQMFWVSMILHLAVILMVAFSRKILPTPIYYAPPAATTVGLVTMEKPKPVKKAIPVAKKTVPAKPKPKPEPEKKIPVPEVKKEKTPPKPIPEAKKEVKPEPVKKKEPPPKEYSDKEINSRIANLKKKVGQQRAAEQQAIAARGRITSKLMEIKYRSYQTTVWEIVQNEWVIPQGSQVRPDLETDIWITIGKNGKILKIDIDKSSGVAFFDDAAIRTIEKSGPFPPLPGDEQQMGMGFHFTPEGLE